MSATVHDTTDGGKVAVLKCESCSTKLRGFTAANEPTALVVAEQEARDAGWVTAPGTPPQAMAWGQTTGTSARHHCPRHHPRRS